MAFESFELCPQHNRFYPARYDTYAINQLVQLTYSGAWVPRLAAIPADGNSSIAARRTSEGMLYAEPGSVLWAIACYSQQPEGVKVQLVENSREKMFQTPVRFDPQSGDAITPRLFILPDPRIVVGPITAQVSNLSPSANTVQIVLYFAEPAGINREADCIGARVQALHQKLEAQLKEEQKGRGLNIVPFREANAIPTPAKGTGPQVVLSYRAPDGHDGRIRTVSNQYTNPSLEEGSGDLIWSIAVDGAFVKGFDRITTTLGSAQLPMEVQGGIPVSSGQLIQYFVEHSATSSLAAAGTQIICTMSGSFIAR